MQVWLLTLSCACGVLVLIDGFAIGFVSGVEALLLGLAVAAYLVEDVLRRVLMALSKVCPDRRDGSVGHLRRTVHGVDAKYEAVRSLTGYLPRRLRPV